MQKKNKKLKIFRIFRREARVDGDSYHQKIVDNTYEARLKRLKEELNGPTVTEIIQMHKLQEKNQTYDDDNDNKNTDKDEIFKQHPPMQQQQQQQQQIRKNATKPLNSNTMPLDQSFDRDR